MGNIATLSNIATGVLTGAQHRFNVRIRRAKFSILGLTIIGAVFILIGSLVLVYLVKDWKTKR